MASTKTISLIISAYNAGKYIAETINNALSQTYRILEIIVVDTQASFHSPNHKAETKVKQMGFNRFYPASISPYS